MAATQRLINLCVEKNIAPDVEIVPVQKVNELFELLHKGKDIGKRYVLDIAGTMNESILDKWDVKPPNLGHTDFSPTDAKPVDALKLSCKGAGCDLKPSRFQRHPVGPTDVLFDLKYCGVCHTDVTTGVNKFTGKTNYPLTPGHELAGVVTAVGEKVKKFKVGDHIGVGCMVDSCQNCDKCSAGTEQYCKSMVMTYDGEVSGLHRQRCLP